MTAREKVLSVEQQIRRFVNGEATEITCPYCELVWVPTSEDAYACCMKMADVMEAVLDYIETAEQLEHVDRVMNKLADMQSKAVLN